MSSLQSRVEAAIAKVRGTTSERSYVHATPTTLSWPDVMALAAEAERLRTALDETAEYLGADCWAEAEASVDEARARSVLYDDDGR